MPDDNGWPGPGQLLDSLSRQVDQHKQLVRAGCCGLAAGGAVLVFRSLRLATQFTSPASIPAEFVRRNVSLFGMVGRAELQGYSFPGTQWSQQHRLVPCISITHVPILGRASRATEADIPVIIPGVQIHSDYLIAVKKEMDDKLTNKKVKIRIFSKTEKEILGQILLKRYGLWNQCFARSLMRNGFARTNQQDLAAAENSVLVMNYLSQLEKKEDLAKRRRNGFWEVENPHVTLLGKLTQRWKRKN